MNRFRDFSHSDLVTGQVQDDEIVDGKILQYCSIDKKDKKTLGELEQEFLQALQVLLHRYTHHHTIDQLL